MIVFCSCGNVSQSNLSSFPWSGIPCTPMHPQWPLCENSVQTPHVWNKWHPLCRLRPLWFEQRKEDSERQLSLSFIYNKTAGDLVGNFTQMAQCWTKSHCLCKRGVDSMCLSITWLLTIGSVRWLHENLREQCPDGSCAGKRKFPYHSTQFCQYVKKLKSKESYSFLFI